MKEKVRVKKETIKDKVIKDFLRCKENAEAVGLNYFPTGLLSYYLFEGKFSTYAGRIINQYCTENNIDIVRSGEMHIDEWDGEKMHMNMRLFVWDKN